MNEQTPVTTAARRIAREVNGRKPGFRLYFDGAGHQVAEVFGVANHGPKAGTYAYEVTVTGEYLTQRGAQDIIDATHEHAEGMAWAVEHADQPHRGGAMTTAYTIEIQATGDGEIWQTIDSPEAIAAAEAAGMGYASAADVARDTARHQNIAEGEDWRVRVWAGEEPDLGAEPDGECYWHEITN